MKNKKYISILFFFIGLSLLIYPLISKVYYDVYYRKESKKIEEYFYKNENDFANKLYEYQRKYNEVGFTDLSKIEMADVDYFENETNENLNIDLSDADVLGILSISKIDLTYPILDGASDENLRKSVARIDGTSYPVGGKNTNSVIAGHNGRINTQFSNIDQLEVGDEIEIRNVNEVLKYEVYSTEIIEPHDIEALAIVPGKDTITLLTCTAYPYTHRYLVYGNRVESEEIIVENVQNKEVKKDKSSLYNIILFIKRYGAIVVILILSTLIFKVIFLKEIEDKS